MKIRSKKAKEFDTVKVFREIKDKISQEIQGMTFEELKAYLEKTRIKTQAQFLLRPMMTFNGNPYWQYFNSDSVKRSGTLRLTEAQYL